MLVAVSNPKTFARASSFWAGIDGFKDADVFSDLKLGGGLVRTCMVRSTLHIIPSKDYHTYIMAEPAKEC